MTLGQLYELYDNGVFNVKMNESKTAALVGGVQLLPEQAHDLCARIGWTGYVLSPFEILDKTNKFIRGIKSTVKDKKILCDTVVTFTNVRSSVYGRTHDRIHLESSDFSVSIIYNMSTNTSKYVIYDSHTSVPLCKCKNLKKVGEYISTLV